VCKKGEGGGGERETNRASGPQFACFGSVNGSGGCARGEKKRDRERVRVR
jgi:hypothetical protein